MGQALDRAVRVGLRAEQRLPGQQEQKGAQALRVAELRQIEALTVPLAAVGAVQPQLDEVADQDPPAAVDLRCIAEGLLHRGEPAVARPLPGIQVDTGCLELQHGPGAVDAGTEPAQPRVRRPVTLDGLGAGLGLHVVDAAGADNLAIAEQSVEDLAQELPLERLLLLAQERAVGDTRGPAGGNAPLLLIQGRWDVAQCLGEQAAVEQRLEIVVGAHARVLSLGCCRADTRRYRCRQIA